MTTVTGNSIVTPQKPVSFTAVTTAAETAMHTPTNQVTLIDETVVGNNDAGLRLTSVSAINRDNAIGTAANLQLYKKVGSTYTLIASVVMATGTPSASVGNQSADFGFSDDNPLILGAGVGLAVASGQAATNGIVFRAHGGAY